MNRVYRDNLASVHWSAFQGLVAALVPLINHASTGYQPPVVFPKTVYIPGHALHDLSNSKPGHTFGRDQASGRVETPAGGRQH